MTRRKKPLSLKVRLDHFIEATVGCNPRTAYMGLAVIWVIILRRLGLHLPYELQDYLEAIGLLLASDGRRKPDGQPTASQPTASPAGELDAYDVSGTGTL